MKLFVFIVVQLLSLALAAQGGFRSRQYLSGSINSITKDIFETSPGNYLACGITVDTLNGVNTNRVIIMKLGNQGEMIWSKKYGTKNLEYLNNNFICRTFYKQGNFIYLACCVRDSNNKQIGAFVKFDLNGDTLWQRFYRDSMDVVPQMVCSSVDGGFLITGFFQDWNGGGQPCLLIKTDHSGNELWRKKINKAGANVSDGKAIIQDSATKKIVIAGYQYIGSPQSAIMRDNVIITDSIGNKLIQRSYYSANSGYLMDLVQTQDKNLVAVGRAYKNLYLGNDQLSCSLMLKIDLNAIQTSPAIWIDQDFDSPQVYNIFTCLRELPNGDLVVGGIIDTMSAFANSMLHRFAIFNSYGLVKKQRYYSYKSNDINYSNNQGLCSLDLTSDGGWVVSIPQAYISTFNPLFYVKYDSIGCDSTPAYCSNPVAVSEYSQTANIDFQMFPNPSSEYVQFTCHKSMNSSIEIIISDLMGRELDHLTFVSEKQIKLDTRKFSEGIYLVRVYFDDSCVETRMLMISK
ncbi:MAG TPA: T9SS type A sorting domain-containing protein [Bacteroidia bacterium]|nr:T9SS type A sorting domain-containing protein [Bacteroidia bacterium]